MNSDSKRFSAAIMTVGITAVLALALFAVTLLGPSSAEAKTKVTWNSPVQCSYYTECGARTASGTAVTSKSMGVAVPYNKVVSKKTWKKGSKAYKRSHFYYGEKLELKHGKRTVKVKVVDCGGFGYCGQYYKGKWAPRLFDLQIAVKKKLKCGSTDIITWRIIS